MKKSLTLLFAVFCFANMLRAQNSVTETVDPKVQQLMARFVNHNRSNTTVKGWRIQILATTDRTRMEQALRQFESLYPNVPADWVHAKPYYKVRAGAFATKREAQRTLYTLKQDYPAAYPVQDNEIKPSELLR